jgi:hypothetical protein
VTCEGHTPTGSWVEDSEGSMRELVIPTEETVNDWNIANDHAGDDSRCPDHWHCDPELAAHDTQPPKGF